MSVEQVQAVVAITLIDLALSGDNALVIGMAARQLPTEQRRRAIVLGSVFAVVLRVAATAAITILLAIPYLQLVGAIALAAIAYRLVSASPKTHEIRTATTLRGAITTIVVADAVMSLENVLGVGGAARGDIGLLAFGLVLSIPIVLFGSGLVASLLDRFPSAIWLGAIALVWTAAQMALEDPALHARVPDVFFLEGLVAGVLLIVIAIPRAIHMRKSQPLH